jgi:hypothetical protein
VNTNRIRINTSALGARLPTVYNWRENVEAGGLMSYGANFPDMFRRTAELIDKVLRGAKPADIPVEQPTKFDLTINLTTAKALGLDLPPSVLARADEVIESHQCWTTAIGALLFRRQQRGSSQGAQAHHFRQRNDQRYASALRPGDLPFGGVGASGMGAYHGIEGFISLSHAKGIFEQSRWNLTGAWAAIRLAAKFRNVVSPAITSAKSAQHRMTANHFKPPRKENTDDLRNYQRRRPNLL